jgi:hypothetical protein
VEKRPSNDETLPIINKPKHPKKGKYKERKLKDPRQRRRQKEPPKSANHKRNIKFPNPLLSQGSYQIRKAKNGYLNNHNMCEALLTVFVHISGP